MNDFDNILFVSRGTDDETHALTQALQIAHVAGARLSIFVVAPKVAGIPEEYINKYEAALAEQVRATLAASLGELGFTESDFGTIPVTVESGATPAIRTVRHVLRGEYDLLVKAAEPDVDIKGFRSFDMDLLRKCPSPVWLARPHIASRDGARVAVAIDPESEERAGHDLALRLLGLSRALADRGNGTLEVVSCWNLEHESYLRHNPWMRMPEQVVDEALTNVEKNHRQALDKLLAESGIAGTLNIRHLRGRPEAIIPEFVAAHQVGLLVMGTVARTGIPGLTLGNTAENVFRALDCSLLALKPPGFVSPVKAY